MERALVIIFRGGQRTMTTAVADRREPRASGILGSVQADVTLSFCKWATVSGNVTARGVMCCLVVTLLIVARVHAQAPQLAPENAPIARWEIPVASTTRATAARHRPRMWLWIAGVSLAAATGYFRIAADRHYLTDVLASAGVGLSVGYGVPALNPPRSGKRPAVTPSVQAHGGQVMATWVC
jgi:hypothetical protein